MNFKYLLPIAALMLSGVASAEIRTNPGVVVRYGDLNLNTQAGVSRLHKRLKNAAVSVCTPLESGFLEKRSQHDQCVAEAIADSVAKVGNVNLTNYHAHKTRGVIVASN